jgi:hypothetical protein
MFGRYDKDIIKKLKELDMQKKFPHEDIHSIQEKHKEKFPTPEEENNLFEDFDNYQSLINGSLSYVIDGRKIPQYQKQYLDQDFFSSYPKYNFLKEELEYYPNLKRELKVYETTREILAKL